MAGVKGRSGRRPKPDALRAKPKRSGERASSGRKIAPRPPADLDERETALWKVYAKPLHAAGVLTNDDHTALRMLVATHARYERLKRETAERGEWTTNPKGYRKKNGEFVVLGTEHKRAPWAIAMENAFAQLHRMLGEFGLTPAMREKVVRGGSDSDTAQHLQMLLGGRGHKRSS